MNKSIKIILSLVLIGALIGGGVLVYLNTRSVNYDISSVQKVENNVQIVCETEDSVTLKKNSKEKFKVLMFTDTHLNGSKGNDNLTLQYIVKNVTEQKPDLVIFGGDNISSAFSKKRTQEFAQVMENLGVYWATVLGNHDGEGVFRYTREELINLYDSYEHCLARQGKKDIDGYGNYTINIVNRFGKVRQVFFLLDSGRYMTRETKAQYGVQDKGQVYDGVKQSQVQWYKQKHDELKAEHGRFKSVMIMHIPPYQTKELAEAEYLYGDRREGICQSGFDSGLFDAIKEKKTTKAVYFGHDHINDFGAEYDGVLLSYIQSSGYGSYNMKSSFDSPEKDWLQGCTLLTFNFDGSYEAERIFNHAHK